MPIRTAAVNDHSSEASDPPSPRALLERSTSAHAPGPASNGVSGSGNNVKDKGQDDDAIQVVEDDSEPAEDEYEIEAILSHEVGRFARGEIAYLVSWVGYGPQDNSWVREADAEHAEEMLARYWSTAHPSKSRVQTRPGATRRSRSVTDGAAAEGERARKRSRRTSEGLSSLKSRYNELADWEPVVQRVEAVMRREDDRLIAFIVFVNGDKYAYDASVPNHRCPQKMLAFYEKHLRFHPRESQLGVEMRDVQGLAGVKAQEAAERRRKKEEEEEALRGAVEGNQEPEAIDVDAAGEEDGVETSTSVAVPPVEAYSELAQAIGAGGDDEGGDDEEDVGRDEEEAEQADKEV